MKNLFKKDTEILRVKNIGGPWDKVYKIIKEEVYSCGAKQMILKDADGWKGEKIYLTRYADDLPFFNLKDIELANDFLNAQIIKENDAKIERDKRLNRN